MKHKISAILMLSLMLSMILMPMAVSADNGKSIIKNMVQAPTDYSVGLEPGDYEIDDLVRVDMSGYYDIENRYMVYLWGWVFWRLD